MKLTSEGVLLTNDRVIQFFENNTSPAIASAFEDHVVTFVAILDEALKQQSSANLHDRELESLARLLTSFEKKQQLLMGSLLETVDQRIRTTTEGMVDKVDSRVSTLAKQVDVSVSASVSRLDLGTLTESISHVMKTWLETLTKQNGLDLKTFESQVTENIRSMVTIPLDTMKTKVFEQLPTTIDSRIRDGLVLFERDLADIKKGVVDGRLDNLLHQALEKVGDNRGDIQTLHSSFPHIVKEIVLGALRKVEDQVNDVRSLVDNKILERLSLMQYEMSETASASRRTRTETEQLKAKIEDLEKQVLIQNTRGKYASNRAKGDDGENTLFDMLSERLIDRDGFSLELVAGQAQSCDILVRKEAHPDIRIDTKNYVSKEKVRAKEVKKFVRDLTATGCHGIMVSLHSGIVGKAPTFDIEQLDNGKLAVYLSNTNCVDSVIDTISVIHRLHAILVLKQDEENEVRFSPEVIQKIRAILLEFGEKMTTIRTKLQESINILNDVHNVHLEQILKTITTNASDRNAIEILKGGGSFVCACGVVCKSGTGLASHKRKCASSKLSLSDNIVT